MIPDRLLHGYLAEFSDTTTLVEAARETRAAGYTRTDAYTPFPLEEVAEALGARSSWLPWLVLLGGIVGGCAGYLMQYYAAVVSYPLNVGGRPLHSWPSFIPVTFEMTVLGAAFTAVLGMLALNRLPMPYHPVFHIPRFALASRDRFFLSIEAADPRFDRAATRQFLESLHARDVWEVPR